MEQNTTNPTQETKTETGQASAASNPGGSKLEQDLLTELTRLGGSFLNVAAAAWNSEQRKQIEKDVKSGLTSLVNNLEEGFKQVSESDQTKDFVNKAEDVVVGVAEKVRQHQVARDLGAGLVKGLRTLSEEIDKLANELQSKNAAQSETPTSPPQASGNQEQEIPINKV
jgi:hypothetical protein